MKEIAWEKIGTKAAMGSELEKVPKRAGRDLHFSKGGRCIETFRGMDVHSTESMLLDFCT